MGLRDELGGQWQRGGTLVRLLLVNVAVFLLLLFIDLGFVIAFQNRAAASDAFQSGVLHWLASTWQLGELLYRPWTVVSYMFTHASFWHLFWNMLILWFSGRHFADLLGEKRLLGNYLLGGLAGLVIYIVGYNLMPVMREGGGLTIIGASASVMSVMLGIAVYRPGILLHFPIIGAVKLIYVALVFLVLDLIAIRAGSNTGGHLAHLGGALYGYLSAKGLMQGRDWSLDFVQRLEGLWRRHAPGKGRARMRVKHRAAPRTRSTRSSDSSHADEKQARQARLDAILDKISRSGYESLSKEEKDFLFRASHDP
jgi:membrane associated rhomboid family serine protease